MKTKMKKKNFVVLSIYEVHMASAALMINGRIVAAAHEERFSRTKLDVGFPYKAALFCLKEAGVKPGDVDCVAMVNERFDPNGIANILFKRPSLYSIQDWVDENERYWKPKLLGKASVGSYYRVMGGTDRVKPHYYELEGLDMDAAPGEITETFNLIRKNTVERLLGISKEKVVFLPHYMCHHYHAYYSGEMRGEDVVVMHMEGDGGKFNAAVSTVTEQGLKIIGGSNQSDLGRLYQWCTLILGMKPYHHEYKIMGLAPYATDRETMKSFKVFEPIFKLDKELMNVVYNRRPKDLYFHFRDRFAGHRFDGIAGALQLLLERHLTDWVKLVVEKTGRRRVCYGGGVAMNVKANMLLSRLDSVDDLFVPLSPGDETNVFGAGYWMTEKHFLANGLDPRDIPPMNTLYPGPSFFRSEVLRAVRDTRVKENGFYVKEKVDGSAGAGLIARGLVVGRFHGRSEFGNRALGNRSILADPSLPGVVENINSKIKYRDFWMPFCPTILDRCAGEYVDNEKNLCADYMTMCFPVKRTAAEKIQGAMHRGDLTARPQILRRERNPAYYDLISEFDKQRGIGAVINTSFNLHGEPIVGSPEDALHTFFNSELDAVWMEDILVSRKQWL